VRIVAWNLGHMARERPISPPVLDMIAHLAPALLVLNEYVHGASRDWFVAGLSDLGLTQCCQSERVGKNNQVLVASRRRFRRGELIGPATSDDAGVTNFLHVVMEDTPLEIVGLRVPTYSGSTRRAYALLMGPSCKRSSWIGTFFGPDHRRLHGDRRSEHLRSSRRGMLARVHAIEKTTRESR